jgi:hypothetical protein
MIVYYNNNSVGYKSDNTTYAKIIIVSTSIQYPLVSIPIANCYDRTHISVQYAFIMRIISGQNKLPTMSVINIVRIKAHIPALINRAEGLVKLVVAAAWPTPSIKFDT